MTMKEQQLEMALEVARDEYRNSTDPEQKKEYLCLMIDSLIGLKQYYDAERICTIALDEQQGDQEFILRMGDIYVQTGRTLLAIPLLQSLQTKFPSTHVKATRASYRLAVAWEQAKELGQAINAAEQALAANLHHEDSWKLWLRLTRREAPDRLAAFLHAQLRSFPELSGELAYLAYEEKCYRALTVLLAWGGGQLADSEQALYSLSCHLDHAHDLGVYPLELDAEAVARLTSYAYLQGDDGLLSRLLGLLPGNALLENLLQLTRGQVPSRSLEMADASLYIQLYADALEYQSDRLNSLDDLVPLFPSAIYELLGQLCYDRYEWRLAIAFWSNGLRAAELSKTAICRLAEVHKYFGQEEEALQSLLLALSGDDLQYRPYLDTLALLKDTDPMMHRDVEEAMREKFPAITEGGARA